MTLTKYFALFLVFTCSLPTVPAPALSGQARTQARHMSHPVMVSRDDVFSTPARPAMAVDTVNILAVMVQFQQDNDQRTSGNGQFIQSSPTDSIIDAPPHNTRYFRDHMTFVENYFRKASKGKVVIRSTVIDSVYTLPGVMAAYSPPKSGSNIAVANLTKETWEKVDSSGLVNDFSAYDCFVLFHAGSGRDVDLVSTLGFDPNPFDIPSLYLGLNAFRSFYGGSYQGIPVQGGTFHITNSIVVPETEYRLIPGAVGDVPLELGINGLLCASVGNFLGLPDLFDTRTGRSAIGRFGLMDGQAIFSFQGVFPPEPSAWEKYWLGWIEPVVLSPGEQTITLPAVSLADSVYRIPISSGEYFLVENRNRDLLRNGQTVTSTYNGIPRQQVFAHDTTGFHALDISKLAGVVTDVEDLDWSLPGGVDPDGTFFDGGVLIWHIDEHVIARNLSTDEVNADPQNRGVDLEEADGSQDIGQQYDFLSPGSGSEEGTPLDFWYQGNSAPVYSNEFSAASYPNSFSNSQANSHITVRSFSARGPRMSATVKIGDPDVTTLPGFPKAVKEILASQPLTAASLRSGAPSALLVSTTGVTIPTLRYGTLEPARVQGKVYAWNADGTAALPGGFVSGLVAATLPAIPGPGPFPGFVNGSSVADVNADNVVEFILGQGIASGGAEAIHAFSARDLNPKDSLADSFFNLPLTKPITTPVVIADSMMAFGDSSGDTHFVRFDSTPIDVVLNSPGSSIVGISRFAGANTFVLTGADGTVRITSRAMTGGTTTADIVRSFGRAMAGPAVAGSFTASTDVRIAFATVDGYLYLVDASLNTVPGFPLNMGGQIMTPPALADIDGDGKRDILVFSDRKIFAYNVAGALLDNFPITVSPASPLSSAPVIADIDGDGNADVVAVSSDGIVAAYERNGKLVRGFPLQSGKGKQSVAVFDVPAGPLSTVGIGLAVASSDDGSVSAWRTGFVQSPGPRLNRPWPQYQKDAQRSGFTTEDLIRPPLSSEFFPADRAYNWPNPVYDGMTFLRYFVRENSSVTVKVFDLAGDLVTEFQGPGVGGVDNEVAWNVGNLQSGIYLARIEANGGGAKGFATVKVAVVK